MHYVYLLVEAETRRIYIGYTSNLRQRIADHKAGKGCKTTGNGNWELVYHEAFLSKMDAMERERKLKHHGSAKRKLFERLSRTLAGQNRAGEADN